MSRSGGLWLATSESSQTGEAEAVFEAMLDGWRTQRRSRLLNENTIANAERVVRRFRLYSGVWPWQWLPGHLEAWVSELRVQEHLAHSTIRSYQGAAPRLLRLFVRPRLWLGTVVYDPIRLGAQPDLPSREHGRAHHRLRGSPPRRPLSRVELQDLFDAADDEVEAIRAGSKKGWAPAFRDATMLKVDLCLRAPPPRGAHARARRLQP